MNKTVVYFENFSCLVFFESVFTNHVFRKFIRKDELVIYYIESTLFVKKILVPLLSLFHIEVYPLEFKLIEIKDERGELVRLRIPRKDLFYIQNKILNSAEYKVLYNEDLNQDRLLNYISKGVIDLGITDMQSMSRILFCIQVVYWHFKKNSYTAPLFIINNRAWFDLYKNYAKNYNVNVFSAGVDGLSIKSTIKKWLRSQAALFNLIKFIEKKQFLNKKPKNVDLNCKLYLEGRGDVNFDNNGEHSDFFWYLNSDFYSDNILYNSVSGDEELLLDNEGVKHVRGLHDLSLKFKREYNKPRISFNEKYKSESKLLKSLINQYDLDRYTWYNFFRKNDVKIYFTWYKYTKDHMAIADAINDNGGIFILWQMAFDAFESSGGVIDCDLSFCASHFSHEIDTRLNSTIKYTVITGYPKDYAPPLLKAKALELRKKLQGNGAEKIVFVIDGNSLEDSRWHTGHELHQENYSYILNKLLETPWLGVVFKPKVAKTLRKRLGPVADLLLKAEKTGRCFVYESSGRRTTSAPPILAGLSADLCIHSDLSSGTAALECALEGIPTLLIDREGCPDSKFYELEESKVIFKNWPDTIDAVMEHFNSANGTPGFGDWSLIIDDLDPFRDGKAANRIGTYLSWLMEGYDKGLGKDLILKNAAEKYRDKWGHDKVIMKLGNS